MNLIHIQPEDLHKDHFTGCNIGIVVSDFNTAITSQLETGCIASLQTYVLQEQIHIIHVPGAVEIPLVLQKMAETKSFTALIALGAVIRGETSHYDYVCAQVSFGCQKIMLDYSLPVIFGVLTTEDEAQAYARAGGTHGNKGSEAGLIALQMIMTLQNL